ncbi:MAG: cobalt-zinc-cadmium efflux system outer membrane protein [Paraglaciecola sp.]
MAEARLDVQTAKLQLQTSTKSMSIMWGEQQPAFRHVQDAQMRLTQTANRPDVSWTAGIRRIKAIDATTSFAGASVPLLSKSRNPGDYEAQRARLDTIEQQKQASLRNLYHQVNQALDARNRALLEVSMFQKTLSHHSKRP